MVTLKDIAAICNVSVATVSNVINGKGKTSDKTAKMIMRVVEEKGYRPNAMARGLRMRRTNMISVIAEDLAQFSTPPIVSGIMRCCEEKGYSVRRAVNVLSGGDCKLALRYQNKYRNVIKAENKNIPHGAAALLKKIRPDEDMAEFSGERLITLKNEINALYDRLFGRIKRENEYLKSRVAALTEELANASAFGSDGTLGYFKNGEKNERVN